MSVLRRRLLQMLPLAFAAQRGFAQQQGDSALDGSQPTQPPRQLIAAAEVQAKTMEKVTGIGGLFFRAQDPSALGQWYLEHLGISLTPMAKGDLPWQQEAGVTSFTPFPEKTKYFGDASKVWMVNFRVRDLDKMAAQLRVAGVAVEVDPTAYPIGRFARLHDPEGNPIELWQPT